MPSCDPGGPALESHGLVVQVENLPVAATLRPWLRRRRSKEVPPSALDILNGPIAGVRGVSADSSAAVPASFSIVNRRTIARRVRRRPRRRRVIPGSPTRWSPTAAPTLRAPSCTSAGRTRPNASVGNAGAVCRGEKACRRSWQIPLPRPLRLGLTHATPCQAGPAEPCTPDGATPNCSGAIATRPVRVSRPTSGGTARLRRQHPAGRARGCLARIGTTCRQSRRALSEPRPPGPARSTSIRDAGWAGPAGRVAGSVAGRI